MALYRRTQNDGIVQNQFWELPDHYWIGTMLINKHTLLPVGGYDTPLVQMPLNAVATYHNNIIYKRFAIGNVMGQTGIMCSGIFPMRYIAPTNDIADIPKAYVRDPSDPNIIYLHYAGEMFGSHGYLIKYDTKTHTVIWCAKNFNSEAFVRVAKVFAIQDGMLYTLMYGTGVNGLGAWAAYHTASRYAIVRVSTDNGSVIGNAITFNVPGTPAVLNGGNNISPNGLHDCRYIGEDAQGKDIFLMAFFDTNPINNANPNGSRTATYRVGYFLYDRASHTITAADGDPFIHPHYDFGNLYQSYGNYDKWIDLPFPSAPDKSITDAIVCYGLTGRLFNWANWLIAPTISKYVYQLGVQRVEQMTALNKNGNVMSHQDWSQLVSNIIGIRFDKFYIIQGPTDKFLMMASLPLFEGRYNGGAYNDQLFMSNDIAGYVAVFKFLDADTIQMVDSIPLVSTDILWLKDDIFVAARPNRIRIFRIDKTTGEIVLLKNIIPASYINTFNYVCVDDISNLWFMELGMDPDITTMRQSSLYFINSFTIAKLVLMPEKSIYKFSGTEVESYIDIQAIGDLGDIVERDVKLTAVGPIKFKETNTKSITTKTSVTSMVRIPFIITGVGDATITMALTAN